MELDETFSAQPLAPVEPLPPCKGQSFLSWLVILVVVGFIVWSAHIRPEEEVKADSHEEHPDFTVMELQGRYFVGISEFVPDQKAELVKQAAVLGRGEPGARLRGVALVGELGGPQDALDNLSEVTQTMDAEWTPDDRRAARLLRTLYQDFIRQRFDAPSVPQADRPFLKERLGWFGNLALHPDDGNPQEAAAVPLPDPAVRVQVFQQAEMTLFAIVGVVVIMCLLGFFGSMALVVFIIAATKGTLKSGVTASPSTNHAGVYAETFALWITLYFCLTLGIGATLPHEWRILGASGAMLVSLLVLFWPVARGISWKLVRAEMGWTLGRNPLLEPAIGIGGYAMSLPLMGLGLILMFILIFARDRLHDIQFPWAADVSIRPHPILEFLAQTDAWGRLQVLFLASIVAPLVEETMFRGVLYRHLRDMSRRWYWIASFLLSAVMSSLIFAIVHPQDIVAVPVLMALAFGFCMIREWRGTLIPGMVAHGFSNGLIMVLVMVALGG